MSAIPERIKKIISKLLGISESKYDENASFSQLGIDSIDEVEIVMSIEEEFGIEISDAEWEKIKTISQLNDLINSKK